MRKYPSASGGRRGRRGSEGARPPDRPGKLLQQARTALFEMRPEEALELCDRVLATMPRVVELLLVRAMSLHDSGYGPLALAHLDTAVDLDPDNGDAVVERVKVLVDLGELETADADLEELVDLWPDDAEITWLRAMVADLRGDAAAADRGYATAARLDPTHFPPPVRVSEAAVVASARKAIAQLPEEVRARLHEVDVQVMPVPDPSLLGEGEESLPPTIAGLFMGSTMVERGSVQSLAPMPTRIFIFQRNLERTVRSEEELEEQVRITVWHEVGHFLGMDEEDLEARGLE